jgi:hypothetical protein
MPFQKGNQLGKNSLHQRRDLTMELLAQLDEVMKYPCVIYHGYISEPNVGLTALARAF